MFRLKIAPSVSFWRELDCGMLTRAEEAGYHGGPSGVLKKVCVQEGSNRPDDFSWPVTHERARCISKYCQKLNWPCRAFPHKMLSCGSC